MKRRSIGNKKMDDYLEELLEGHADDWDDSEGVEDATEM